MLDKGKNLVPGPASQFPFFVFLAPRQPMLRKVETHQFGIRFTVRVRFRVFYANKNNRPMGLLQGTTIAIYQEENHNQARVEIRMLL